MGVTCQMITGVRGLLASTGPDWVHVTVGGVTLQVFVPSNCIAALGSTGSMVSLHTLLRIREEQPILYGFPDDASVQLFTLLTGVSGVGPRLALALLGSLDSASLQLAVASGDAAALAAAPGVGRRIANRIILELRGKVDDIEGVAGSRFQGRQRRGHGGACGPWIFGQRGAGGHRRHSGLRRSHSRGADSPGPSAVRAEIARRQSRPVSSFVKMLAGIRIHAIAIQNALRFQPEFSVLVNLAVGEWSE